ncbi:hypothetical protein [Pseudoroseomonas cervicalis]|uniref:hypothetical protein n=1 Tax=Teichococcus cervicalis TaxID=204525 RepID=UPI0022F1708D|nr:hypothetical protein [Pseudoroseomonas cervicalis]WBV42611.1 hypothetical protein PFY06_15405 [Pseudoroseomonas cervicalis]
MTSLTVHGRAVEIGAPPDKPLRTERGQGIQTGLARLLAEEPDIPFGGRIRVGHPVEQRAVHANVAPPRIRPQEARGPLRWAAKRAPGALPLGGAGEPGITPAAAAIANALHAATGRRLRALPLAVTETLHEQPPPRRAARPCGLTPRPAPTRLTRQKEPLPCRSDGPARTSPPSAAAPSW